MSKKLVVAISCSAVEFLDEEVHYYSELLPEFLEEGKYFYNKEKETYKHQWLVPVSIAEEMNRLLDEKKNKAKSFQEIKHWIEWNIADGIKNRSNDMRIQTNGIVIDFYKWEILLNKNGTWNIKEK
jgi:hypothetical protein